MVERITADSSVIIDSILSQKIEKKEIKAKEIIIHHALVQVLERLANENKAKGFLGIDELNKLKELSSKNKFSLKFSGQKLRDSDMKYITLEDIDSKIMDLAYEEDASIVTCSKIISNIADAKDVSKIYVEKKELNKKLVLEKYFDDTTMSVHLRENLVPYAKKGKPGEWQFVEIGKQKLSRERLQEISREIIEEAGQRKDGFIEIERPGSTIIQLANFRTVITKPPFSDGWEITAVRPVKRLTLEDYGLSEKLIERIKEQAEGILIAGSPGMGKSTFAQGLIEFYASQKKTVKTIEAPRDLVLSENVTQYAISHGNAQEIHDVLLLCRPDYTLFDEMRNTDDFRLFADLRLSGIGLAGVVHATNPIDAIQRFVGRIELGVIPQVIDTVIFIKNGNVEKILSLNMTVKVPSGMTEADLARPVVVVNDFETSKPEFELYSYGEETVVIPVKGSSTSKPSHELASKTVKNEFANYGNVEVEFASDHKCVVYVPESAISKIIGKQGKNIEKIEKKLGIGIDIRALGKDKEKEIKMSTDEEIPYETKITKKFVQFELDIKKASRDVNIFIDNDFVMQAKVGKTGIISVHKKNKVGKMLSEAVTMGDSVKIKG